MGPCSRDDLKAGDAVAVAVPIGQELGDGTYTSAFALVGRVINTGVEIGGKGELLEDTDIMQAGLQVIFTSA